MVILFCVGGKDSTEAHSNPLREKNVDTNSLIIIRFFIFSSSHNIILLSACAGDEVWTSSSEIFVLCVYLLVTIRL